MTDGYKIVIAAMIVLGAAPAASAQSVRDGIMQWQKGDHAAAVATWTSLAAQGDADAAFNLAQAYRLGKGVPIDLTRAQALFMQAARKGHVDAATTLGLLLFQNGDPRGAMRWLSQAASAGEPRAMLLFGTALYNGDGTLPDPVRAYAFVSRSAAQGYAPARASLLDLDQAMPIDQRQRGIALAQAMANNRVPASVTAHSPLARKAPIAPKPMLGLPPPSGAGDWKIQLGAFGKRAAAEALFARVRGQLGAVQPFYTPAGKVIRLQIGPYTDRAAASAACAALRGQPCLTVAPR